MNDEFLSKLTDEARKVKLDPSEKAQLRAKLGDFVKAHPLAPLPSSAHPFSASKFFGQHFGQLALASVLIVAGLGIVSVTKNNPAILSPTVIPTGDTIVKPANSVIPAGNKKVEYTYPPAISPVAATPTSTVVNATSTATTTTDEEVPPVDYPRATTTTKHPSRYLLP